MLSRIYLLEYILQRRLVFKYQLFLLPEQIGNLTSLTLTESMTMNLSQILNFTQCKFKNTVHYTADATATFSGEFMYCNIALLTYTFLWTTVLSNH